jgi:NAD(P)-dependent dehydrogenase (short-subunit alcohol dehydrogenase family)
MPTSKIFSMRHDLRSVLVTGASTAIGYALAQRLDADGWRVITGVRTDADAQRLRRLVGAANRCIARVDLRLPSEPY